MGLIHIPRVIASIGKGFLRRQGNPECSLVGLSPKQPHIYHARAGIFDTDYLGHLNNSVYLVHAELARWELTASNGLLSTMYKHNVHFFVAGSCIRYRREIRPLFRKFQIDSYVAGLDERNIWISHKFRYPVPGQDRVRAQILVQGVAVKDKKVLDPRTFFKEQVGVDADIVDRLTLPNVGEATMEEMLERYVGLEEAMKKDANLDDQSRPGK